MPQKIILSDVVFTDTSLPIIRDDPLLSAGSLLLWDPGHSLGVFSGIPADGASMPNVAWKEAAALLGSGSQASLATVAVNSGNVANVFQTERSGKGGVHGIITQAGGQAAQAYFVVRSPAAIRDYIYANRATRKFYFSAWWRTTRKTITNTANQSAMDQATNTSNYLFNTQDGLFSPSGASPQSLGTRNVPSLGEQPSPNNTVRYSSGAVLGVQGTGPLSTEFPRLGAGTFGAWGNLNFNKAPSRLLYRFYIEDLTASGRSYADVDAIDYALWQAAFSAGGKFYNDTFTDPSTLP